MISLIQDFEVDFLWKVSLKILNSGIESFQPTSMFNLRLIEIF